MMYGKVVSTCSAFFSRTCCTYSCLGFFQVVNRPSQVNRFAFSNSRLKTNQSWSELAQHLVLGKGLIMKPCKFQRPKQICLILIWKPFNRAKSFDLRSHTVIKQLNWFRLVFSTHFKTYCGCAPFKAKNDKKNLSGFKPFSLLTTA